MSGSKQDRKTSDASNASGAYVGEPVAATAQTATAQMAPASPTPHPESTDEHKAAAAAGAGAAAAAADAALAHQPEATPATLLHLRQANFTDVLSDVGAPSVVVSPIESNAKFSGALAERLILNIENRFKTSFQQQYTVAYQAVLNHHFDMDLNDDDYFQAQVDALAPVPEGVNLTETTAKGLARERAFSAARQALIGLPVAVADGDLQAAGQLVIAPLLELREGAAATAAEKAQSLLGGEGRLMDKTLKTALAGLQAEAINHQQRQLNQAAAVFPKTFFGSLAIPAGHVVHSQTQTGQDLIHLNVPAYKNNAAAKTAYINAILAVLHTADCRLAIRTGAEGELTQEQRTVILPELGERWPAELRAELTTLALAQYRRLNPASLISGMIITSPPAIEGKKPMLFDVENGVRLATGQERLNTPESWDGFNPDETSIASTASAVESLAPAVHSLIQLARLGGAAGAGAGGEAISNHGVTVADLNFNNSWYSRAALEAARKAYASGTSWFWQSKHFKLSEIQTAIRQAICGPHAFVDDPDADLRVRAERALNLHQGADQTGVAAGATIGDQRSAFDIAATATFRNRMVDVKGDVEGDVTTEARLAKWVGGEKPSQTCALLLAANHLDRSQARLEGQFGAAGVVPAPAPEM